MFCLFCFFKYKTVGSIKVWNCKWRERGGICPEMLEKDTTALFQRIIGSTSFQDSQVSVKVNRQSA